METSGIQTLLQQPLIARDELALKLGVSVDTVHSWTSERRIPCFRLGHRTVRYSYAGVVTALSRFYKPQEHEWSRKLPKRRRNPISASSRTFQTELVLKGDQLLFPFVDGLFNGNQIAQGGD